MKTILSVCRRNLAALMCMAIAIALFATPETAWAKKEKKIGIQLYSVMDAMNKAPKASIERLAGMGYKAVELVQWGGNPKVFGLPADEFKALCYPLRNSGRSFKRGRDYEQLEKAVRNSESMRR